ncbi:MAG: hypothetical protein JWO77_3546 [Ilumatobacteraceae bacterium]|nr:hypothetical protein [Ilumatobacteraceae bacterium]
MFSDVSGETELKVTIQITPPKSPRSQAQAPMPPAIIAQNLHRPAEMAPGPFIGLSPLRRRASTATAKVIGPPIARSMNQPKSQAPVLIAEFEGVEGRTVDRGPRFGLGTGASAQNCSAHELTPTICPPPLMVNSATPADSAKVLAWGV